MKITRLIVEHMASLARLELTDAEYQMFPGQLDAIIAYVATLNELELLDVEGTSRAVPLDCPMRDDAVGRYPDFEKVLNQAPQRQEGFFTVPRIIE